MYGKDNLMLLYRIICKTISMSFPTIYNEKTSCSGIVVNHLQRDGAAVVSVGVFL